MDIKQSHTNLLLKGVAFVTLYLMMNESKGEGLPTCFIKASSTLGVVTGVTGKAIETAASGTSIGETGEHSVKKLWINELQQRKKTLNQYSFYGLTFFLAFSCS